MQSAALSADVVIIGAGAIGSAIAWFLSGRPDFNGRIVLIERDATYAQASSALSASCIRHQFSNAINVQMSMFGTQFVKTFREQLGGHPDVPEIALQEIGYLFLADDATAQVLIDNQQTQAACGARTELLEPAEIAARFPFYNLDDVELGSFNGTGEGWFDGYGMMQALKAAARRNGVAELRDTVVGLECSGSAVTAVRLASGDTIGCGVIVNAAGPRAAELARMAGVSLPVEPRKRSLFVFSCPQDLGQPMPLTIDLSGVHCRSEGRMYLAGAVPTNDRAVAFDDFDVAHNEFDEIIWPALAHRVPAFEAIRVERAWAGHYEYSTLDQNAVIGPHPEIDNLIFANGFSGHGLQHAPAVGRGISELIATGRFQTLDLSPFHFNRIVKNRPFKERAII